MIVKCKEMRKEYKLKLSEEYKNYHCGCGGDLMRLTLQELNQRNRIRKLESQKVYNPQEVLIKIDAKNS